MLLATWMLGACAGGPAGWAGSGRVSSALEIQVRAGVRPPAEARVHPDRFVRPEEVSAGLAGAAAVAERVAAAVAGEGGGGRPLRGAVVPHHLVAGHLVAGLLAYLAPDPPSTVVVVGPDHGGHGPPCGVSLGGWQTAWGVVETDSRLAAALVEEGLAADAWAVHDTEHSLGVLMPFVRRLLPGARVVPLSVTRGLGPAEAARLGRLLARWAEEGERRGERLFVIASVDFSHGLPFPQAERMDEETLEALGRGDWGRLYAFGPGNLDSPAALAVLFSYAGCLEEPRFAVAAHTNSATLLGRPGLDDTTSHFLLIVP
ncbi:MAG: AmmeMemoRadiSam system protein B [Firmicutes bacterium]|nr:AmmeMemoRadiSam system protein B [Bacillota bacterium]